MCVSFVRICLPLTGSGRRFAGLDCRALLPISPLIRAAAAGVQASPRRPTEVWLALKSFGL